LVVDLQSIEAGAVAIPSDLAVRRNDAVMV
jgi:hypothetical protein